MIYGYELGGERLSVDNLFSAKFRKFISGFGRFDLIKVEFSIRKLVLVRDFEKIKIVFGKRNKFSLLCDLRFVRNQECQTSLKLHVK